MADSLTADHWTQLRSMRPQSEDALATLQIAVDASGATLSAAIDHGGYLHLLIDAAHGPDSEPLPDLNGLRVRHRRLALGDVLDLSAHPSHERVFTPFCVEIIDAVVREARDPWKAVAASVRAWRSAWKAAQPAMDKTVQVGLFGELLVLRTLMIPTLGPFAVDHWSGPETERHDFVSSSVHIEVKATRRSRPEHEISRLDQLHSPPGTELLFVSVQLEESIGGSESLATEVDAIVDLLRGDPAALDLFMAKIATLGWAENVRTSGELLRFFVRKADVYVVDEDFPRLPDDFLPPTGVVAVRYTIDLANLPSLGMDEATLMIRAANAGHGH